MILVLAVAGLGQKLPKGFNQTYDKFKDVTLIDFVGRPIITTKRPRSIYGVYVRGYFNFDSAELKADAPVFWLHVEAASGACRSWCFIRDHDFILLLDGKPYPLKYPKGDWNGNASSDYEAVTFSLERSELEQIIKAAKVEFQLGSFEGELKEKDLAYFKTLLDLGTAKK